MGKIYTGQDKLHFYINTGADLSDAATVYLEGTDPAGSSITQKLLNIEDATRGIVYLKVLDTYFTTAGVWRLWVHINYDGGDEAWSEPFSLQIYDSGS